MAISTKLFHPLDAENNRRYRVTAKADPKIIWHKTEETGAHDWEGYIRIEEDGDYTFSVTLDDNGYIEVGGKKVVEITGTNSSTSKTGEPCFLRQGFHYVRLHHKNEEVPKNIAPYPNAEQFVPKLNGEDIKLWEIDAPENLMTREEAQKLLSCYNVVDYLTMFTDDVYAYIGGWLDRVHLKESADNVPMAERQYYNSCALRLSIALSKYGYNLAGVPGANNIRPDEKDGGNAEALGGRKHVIISAGNMAAHLRTIFGEPDYNGNGEDGYSTPQEGDIVIFGNKTHVGMCPGDDASVGSFICGDIWLLQRATLDDKE